MTFTLFTLHCYRIRVGLEIPAYLCERTCEFDVRAFYTARNSKICFVQLACSIAKAGE